MQQSSKRSHLRESLTIFLPVIVLVIAAFWITLQFVQPAPPPRIVVAAATKGSPYYVLAERYRDKLAANGIAVEILETAGSFENLKLLQDDQAGVQAGFLQGGIASATEAPHLQSLGRVLYEPLWIFQRVGEPAERLSDFKKKRLLVGPQGSGTSHLAMTLLAAAGIDAQNTTFIHRELLDDVDVLEQGAANAGFLVLAANARTVQRLFANPKVQLMRLHQADALTQRFPYLTRLELREGIVNLAANIPPADTPMVATVASFVVREDIHPAIANLLTQAMVAVHGAPTVGPNGEAGILEASGEFPIQNDPAFQIADEARRVYRNGPPFLQRYLPFWLANFLDRMPMMAIPIFGVLLPALRFAPQLYTWRVRRRLLRWYRELKKIEDGLNATATQETLRKKQARIEQIEEAVDHVNVPLGFANQLYDLREHIDVVRRRLSALAP